METLPLLRLLDPPCHRLGTWFRHRSSLRPSGAQWQENPFAVFNESILLSPNSILINVASPSLRHFDYRIDPVTPLSGIELTSIPAPLFTHSLHSPTSLGYAQSPRTLQPTLKISGSLQASGRTLISNTKRYPTARYLGCNIGYIRARRRRYLTT